MLPSPSISSNYVFSRCSSRIFSICFFKLSFLPIPMDLMSLFSSQVLSLSSANIALSLISLILRYEDDSIFFYLDSDIETFFFFIVLFDESFGLSSYYYCCLFEFILLPIPLSITEETFSFCGVIL